MNKIKNVIIILIIIIFIILTSLIILKINFNKEENDESTDGDVGETIEITNQIEDVEDISTFKNVERCVQKYYNMMNNESIDYYQRDENGEYKKIDENEINKKKLCLLSKDFISNNNINSSNIYKYIKDFSESGTVIALNMKELINTEMDKYIVQGVFVNIDNEIIDEFYIIVNIDSINETFSIEPVEDEYKDINDIKINNENKSIEKNDYNQFENDVYDYEKRAEDYFMVYKRLALSKPEILYNCMDIEYRNKRFGEQEVFENYITENKDEIQGLEITEYLVNNKQEVTEFICKDQYKNIYIFEESLPMKFSLKLDNYTIATEKFKTEYEKALQEKKIQMNIDKFVQMINRHDYISSYKCISEGYKNNYFDTQDKFEDYIKENFFPYNKFEFNSIDKKGNNVYVCKVQLSDLTGESSEEKEINIIMKLNDNWDFEMSFGI